MVAEGAAANMRIAWRISAAGTPTIPSTASGE
jgi:hypothetical protein